MPPAPPRLRRLDRDPLLNLYPFRQHIDLVRQRTPPRRRRTGGLHVASAAQNRLAAPAGLLPGN
jgi:hypothetical protein